MLTTHDDCGASAKHNLNQQQDKTHLDPTEFLCEEPLSGPVLKTQAAATVATIVSSPPSGILASAAQLRFIIALHTLVLMH